mgnify:CR=1 FL=1
MKRQSSALEQARRAYRPQLPQVLTQGVETLAFAEGEPTSAVRDAEAIRERFPNGFGRPMLSLENAFSEKELLEFEERLKRFLKTETNVSFVPLKLEDLLDIPAPPESASLSLVINNHFKIEIRPGFDAQLLRQLIFALRGVT